MWRIKYFLLLAATLAVAATGRAAVTVGESFPDLGRAGLVGDVPAVAGRVVLVDFWASWCAPCKTSFPAYARLQADFAARGLVIVAVSVDEDPVAYASFVKRMAPSFAVLRDKDQQLVSQVAVPAMPTCFLVDRDGRVRSMHRGFHGAETENEIRRELESLLGEKSKSS